MFSVLMQFSDGHEVLDASDDIRWNPYNGGGQLIVGDREYALNRGDVAYVMNEAGATVRKYGGK